MLKRINGKDDMTGAEIPIRNADFPAPFASGLEYNAPARGPWNIVHTGMLIPESHQIFACAQGCLRGVILTAAEMKAMDRMSWISIRENDLFDGSLEQNVIDGTTDILNQMSEQPRAVLVFLSCIQLFAGCDFSMILNELRRRFPKIDFTDCYMNPTMRKNGLTPDQIMRKQLYSLWKPRPLDTRAVNLIGNDRATKESSELVRMIRRAGFELRDITLCRTYEKYQRMAGSFLNLTYIPAAKASGDNLTERFGQRHLYLPLSYSYAEIEQNYALLAEALGISVPDFSEEKERAEHALTKTLDIIRETPVELDYTATPRPLGLARLLTEHGFRVKTVYADVFTGEEQNDFVWLRRNLPELKLCATVHVKMRFAGKGVHETGKVLAIGQKAAYFSGSPYFVDLVAGGGQYGFDGIANLAELMTEAFLQPKDTETVIQHKGWGCESCL